jgi:hypothetical protein
VARRLSSAVIVSVVSFTSTPGRPDDISAPYTLARNINCRNRNGLFSKHTWTSSAADIHDAYRRRDFAARR